MLRKIIAIAIAAAMLTALFVMPASAESLQDKLTFYVDYRTESMDDKTGTYSTDENSDDPTWSEVGGVKSAQFGSNGSSSFYYNGPSLLDYDLSQGLTLEAYIYLDPDKTNTSNFFAVGYNAVCMSDYNTNEDHLNGFRCSDRVDDNWTNPEGGMCNAYQEQSLERGKWYHMLGTSNGTINEYYLDGVKVAEKTRTTTQFHPMTMNESLAKVIVVGEGQGWGSTEGNIALLRLYKTYVTEAEAQALYADVTGGTIPSVDPSNPTPTPGSDPTPTTAPTTAPSGGGGNAKTFDIGIVALAAVSLSTLVAVKRKKK